MNRPGRRSAWTWGLTPPRRGLHRRPLHSFSLSAPVRKRVHTTEAGPLPVIRTAGAQRQKRFAVTFHRVQNPSLTMWMALKRAFMFLGTAAPHLELVYLVTDVVPFRHSVRGQLPWQQQAQRRLHLAGRDDGPALVVMLQAGSLAGDVLKDVEERIHDAHGLR